ncbi:MAG: DUF86 domain-containing protein [Anaerolineae bacterium]|nr:DUF86 domain-containing protein [Anaerolineae bacterium]
MRRDDALFLDILIAARKIQQFTFEMTKADFKENQMAQSAVIREFQVMGEAAKQISAEAQTQNANLPLQKIAGMRNRMVHEYFRIDLDIVWNTVQQEILGLITQLQSIVPPENP